MPYFPQYYVPIADVRTELLTPTGDTVSHSPSHGDTVAFTVTARRAHVRWTKRGGPATRRSRQLRDHVRFNFRGVRCSDGSRRTRRSRSIHAIPGTRIDVLEQLAARAGDRARRDSWPTRTQPAAPLRDRAADYPVLPPEGRCPDGAARAPARPSLRLPVQGAASRVLVSCTPSGPRPRVEHDIGVVLPAPRCPESQKVAGPRLALQRAGSTWSSTANGSERPHTKFS